MSRFVDSILQDYAEAFGDDENYADVQKSPQSIDVPKEIQDSQILPKGMNQFGMLATSDALEIVENMKNEHIKDTRLMLDMQTENAKLKAQIEVYEATNRHADQLASTIEELTNKYIQTIQMRTQQTALIKKLRMEIDALKSSFPQEPTYGRF